MCVYVCLCVRVCVSLAMGMHHVLIILTLTFIQGRTDLNYESNKCSIISKTSSNAHQTCYEDDPIKGLWPVPVRWPWPPCKVTSASQTWLLFNLQYLGQYISYYIQTWHDGSLMHGIDSHAVSMTLTLMQCHSGSANAKIQCRIISTAKQATTEASNLLQR